MSNKNAKRHSFPKDPIVSGREQRVQEHLAKEHIRSDFDVVACLSKADELCSETKKADRRHRESLYRSIVAVYVLHIASANSEFQRTIEEYVVKTVGKRPGPYAPATLLAHAFITQDRTRASQYGLAMRGAALMKLSPDTLWEKFEKKEVTIEKLVRHFRKNTPRLVVDNDAEGSDLDLNSKKGRPEKTIPMTIARRAQNRLKRNSSTGPALAWISIVSDKHATLHRLAFSNRKALQLYRAWHEEMKRTDE